MVVLGGMVPEEYSLSRTDDDKTGHKTSDFDFKWSNWLSRGGGMEAVPLTLETPFSYLVFLLPVKPVSFHWQIWSVYSSVGHPEYQLKFPLMFVTIKKSSGSLFIVHWVNKTPCDVTVHMNIALITFTEH